MPPEIPNTQTAQGLHSETIPSRQSSTLRTVFPPMEPSLAPTQTIHRPLGFVLLKHESALSALTSPTIPMSTGVEDVTFLRSVAISAVEQHGWIWPSILDEEFPAATPGGLQYDRVIIDGQPYLSLRNPSETPTAFQAHALEVLSYTFTLLSIDSPPATVIPSSSTQPVTIPPNVNQLLQQLGLPPLRVAEIHNPIPNQNALLPELREIPLRPLLAPMIMLVLRTLLLLYFVAPARKPIFAILILAWMLYEIWQPIRNGFLRGIRRAMDNRQHQNAERAARQGQHLAQNAHPAQQPPADAPVAGPIVPGVPGTQAGVLLDTLANMNIEEEQNIINQTPGTVTSQPGLGHKIMSFFGLLITTLHPAIWNRRRVALRRREGVIRTEMSMPTPQEAGENGPAANRASQTQEGLRSQHARQPLWIQRYMERVVAADWVDDSD